MVQGTSAESANRDAHKLLTKFGGKKLAEQFKGSREFVRGFASRGTRVYIISKGKQLLKKAIAHTSLIGVNNGEWAGVFDTMWDSSAVTGSSKPSSKLVLIGEDGDVATWGANGEQGELIQPPPVAIRNAKCIDGYAYACGMKRQVYFRVDEGEWRDISAPASGPTDSVGFEAIDGFSIEEIYAAGWQGELWQFDGKVWTLHGNMTSCILTSVCCAPNGVVYVAGQQGTMLRGRNAVWEQIPWDDPVSIDIWDLCWYKGSLFVATHTGIYRLDNNRLIPLDFGSVGAFASNSLSVADDILWTVGHDAVASFDGVTWKRYD